MTAHVGRWLLAAGLLGVLSLLLVPFEKIAPATGLPPSALRLAAILQPAILTVAFVLIGSALAPRVGLRAPLLEEWTAGRSGSPVLRRQIGPALLTAAVVALMLTGYALLVTPRMLAGESEALADFIANEPPLVTRLLYGGITEELITRWGLVSLFAWAAWRFIGRPAELPPWSLWLAIGSAALLFAAGHLPLLFALVPSAPSWIVLAVLLGNAIPGLLFGYLFWKQGIEAAIVAHGGAHALTALLRLM